MFPPILKFLAFFENKGLLTPLLPPLAPEEAVTTFLPFETFFDKQGKKEAFRIKQTSSYPSFC